MLREVENLVAEAVEVNVPFMNPIAYVLFLHLFRLFSQVDCPCTQVHLLIKRAFTPRLSLTTLARMKF